MRLGLPIHCCIINYLTDKTVTDTSKCCMIKLKNDWNVTAEKCSRCLKFAKPCCVQVYVGENIVSSCANLTTLLKNLQQAVPACSTTKSEHLYDHILLLAMRYLLCSLIYKQINDQNHLSRYNIIQNFIIFNRLHDEWKIPPPLPPSIISEQATCLPFSYI